MAPYSKDSVSESSPLAGRNTQKGVLLGLLCISLSFNIFARGGVCVKNIPAGTSRGGKNENGSSQHSNSNNTAGWIRPNVIYGHVHMAKTAGTEINGELAMMVERICGHKGYSFDAYEANRRFAKLDHSNDSVQLNVGDFINQHVDKWSRQRVPFSLMAERGFDDCDWISTEQSDPNFWLPISRKWKMELHVPCRDPLAHLMSMCNHGHPRVFDCDAANITAEIVKCGEMSAGKRFGTVLQHQKNIELKCFDPIPPQKYLDYMGGILQRKRVQAKYIHRDTNEPRNKDLECIWKSGAAFQDKVVQEMKKTYPFFAFCDQCMQSDNQLPL